VPKPRDVLEKLLLAIHDRHIDRLAMILPKNNKNGN
jgi:hypothetical protein